MAWLKMFLKFIVDIVHYAAWPLLVIGVLYLFREPLRIKIRELTKIGHKDTYLDFTSIPKKKREMLKSGDFLPSTKETINYDWYLESTGALAMLIGILALELKKYNVKSRLLQMAQLTLTATLKQLKKDKPDIEGLDVIELCEKLIKLQEKQKTRSSFLSNV